MGKMNLMDRAIAAVAPERALRRAAARESLRFINSGYGNYGASTTKKSKITSKRCAKEAAMLTWACQSQPAH